MNLRSIVCPVDFSDPSKQALRWAAAFARRFQSRLTIVTAVDPLLAEAARARLGLDLATGETGPELRAFVNGVIPDGAAREPEIAYEVRVGDPADVVRETSRRLQADLVVMGTQGLGGLKKMILGSTAERVLRTTRTPVLTVPPPAAGSVVMDAAEAGLPVDRILAATDFTDAAAAAVRWAAGLADALSVPLTLAHVVEPLVVVDQWSAVAAGADELQLEEARRKLDRQLAALTGTAPRESVVSLGRPAETIAALSEEKGAGLIVVGLTGDQGLMAPRPGSIAYRVLTLAKTAVLVVPPEPAAFAAGS